MHILFHTQAANYAGQQTRRHAYRLERSVHDIMPHALEKTLDLFPNKRGEINVVPDEKRALGIGIESPSRCGKKTNRVASFVSGQKKEPDQKSDECSEDNQVCHI